MSKFKKLVSSHPVVLVDFYADWCGPCKTMAPELDKLKKELGDRLKLVKINTEKNKLLSSEMGIRSIPTLVLYKNGKLAQRKAGGMRLKELLNFVNPHL
jgi:thioredoxin 1